MKAWLLAESVLCLLMSAVELVASQRRVEADDDLFARAVAVRFLLAFAETLLCLIGMVCVLNCKKCNTDV